jgi:5-methylcytosine-specific restriction enzyme A
VVILRACTVCGRLSSESRCPTHRRKAWEGSNRRERTRSGWSQQRRARYILRRDEGRCHRCGRPGATIADHVIALAEGGADDVDNMAPICVSCNRQKVAEEAARGRLRSARASEYSLDNQAGRRGDQNAYDGPNHRRYALPWLLTA